MNLKSYISNPYVKAGIAIFAIYVIYFHVIPIIKGLISKSGSKAKQLASGQKATLTEQQAKDIADSIYGSLSSDWFNDTASVFKDFGNVHNDADYYEVENAFGVRKWGLAYLSSGDLSQFLTAFLSKDDISKINKILSDNGLTFQF